jgi:hypothetical protein|tara:strand:+ start:2881 stop:3252 length:372 start_codon:yes stop_codon:yes gene_type:complete
MNSNSYQAPEDAQSVGTAAQQGRVRKSPSKPALELLCVTVGFVGTGTELAVLFYKHMLPDEVFEFFRGGNAGGMLVGLSLLAGLIAFPMFIVNVFSGSRSWWAARFGLILCVWVMILILSAMV